MIAAAVILLAARATGHALPLSPPWWTLLEATLPGTGREGGGAGPWPD